MTTIPKSLVNIRIGLGGDIYQVNSKDLPFIKKLLKMFEDKA